MSRSSPEPASTLFYSYSHKDKSSRESMENSLTLLKKNGLLTTWSDHEILPGQDIPSKIRAAMDNAEIMTFLFSQHFIASTECMKEWERAKELSEQDHVLFRIPIILQPCAWKDVLADDLVKALPNDGKSVSSFRDKAAAWQQVYQRIKRVLETLKPAASPRKTFVTTISETEFIFANTAMLPQLFIFPTLSHHQLKPTAQFEFRERTIGPQDIFQRNYTLVYGDDVSGKSSLLRHLFLTHCEDACKRRRPVVIDLENSAGQTNEEIVEAAYRSQYIGDYSLWRSNSQNIALIDNLSFARKHMQFMEFAKSRFKNVIVAVPSQIYHSYFYDDPRFAEFYAVEIRPLTHHQQELLVRKVLSLSKHSDSIPDGLVDHVEAKVNGIIISNRIVPRYPFYVLSILQSEERFMPDVPLTSFGHCYYVLIVAHLVKSGVSQKDEDINACFNFLEHLAYWIFSGTQSKDDSKRELDDFVLRYRETFFVSDSLISRLRHPEYGILSGQGEFRRDYMYYYFIGKYLANDKDGQREIIHCLCRDSYVGDNHLIVLFLIHHTSDDHVIDEVLVDCLDILSEVGEATLEEGQTVRFSDIVSTIPKSILSDDSVQTERRKERQVRDLGERQKDLSHRDWPEDVDEQVKQLYKLFRSIEILGQVLKNKYGVLPKVRLNSQNVGAVWPSPPRGTLWAMADRRVR